MRGTCKQCQEQDTLDRGLCPVCIRHFNPADYANTGHCQQCGEMETLSHGLCVECVKHFNPSNYR